MERVVVIETDRLVLRAWHEGHRREFAALHSDPEVMADLGGPLTRQDSDEKFDRYRQAFDRSGIARWAVENHGGSLLGYAGIMLRPDPAHPLGPHAEIGWRSTRDAWGQGYATESARASLEHGRQALRGREIIAYTDRENRKSQAVMGRLDFRRDPSRDFSAVYSVVGAWHGLVWVAPSEQ